MEFRQIRYFIEIYKKKSFGNAASGLGLTQPALSRQIALLERELGLTLFDRSARTIRLTASGEKFLRIALGIHDLWKEGVQELHRQNRETELKGEYSISSGGTVAAFLLPSALLKIREKFPELTLKVVEGDAATTLRSLLDGEADIGILTGPVKDKRISHKHFMTDTIVPAVAISHPLSLKKNPTVSDIIHEDFVLFHPASAIRQVMEKKYRSLKPAFQPNVAMELRSIESVIRSIEAGLGIGFISRFAVTPKIKILNIPELTAERNFYFCYRNSARGIEILIEAIENAIQIESK